MLKICIIQQAVPKGKKQNAIKKNLQTFLYKIRKISNLVFFIADTDVAFSGTFLPNGSQKDKMLQLYCLRNSSLMILETIFGCIK